LQRIFKTLDLTKTHFMRLAALGWSRQRGVWRNTVGGTRTDIEEKRFFSAIQLLLNIYLRFYFPTRPVSQFQDLSGTN
jgi:hypothetical protein